MKSFFIKNTRLLAIIFAVCVGLLLIVTATFMLSDYQVEIQDRAVSSSLYYSSISKNDFNNTLDEYNIHTSNIATKVAEYDNLVDFTTYLNNLTLTTGNELPIDSIKSIRYYKDGKLYTSINEEVTTYDPSITHYESNPLSCSYIGSYDDSDLKMTVIGFYAPVYDSDFADAVIVYYTQEILKGLFIADNNSSLREFSILTNNEGNIISGDSKDSKSLSIYSFLTGNVVTTLRNLVGDKEPMDELTRLLNKNEDSYLKIQIGTEDYIVTILTDKTNMSDLRIVEMYSVSKLCASGLEFVNTITAIIIIFTIIVISLIVYLFLYNRQIRRKLFNIATTDPVLQCNNRNGFERATDKLIDINLSANFYVMVCEIRHFKHIQESIGEADINNALRFIRFTLSKSIFEEETFGYAGDGEYLLTMHARNRESLIDRLKVINAIILKNRFATKLDVQFKFGIYEVNRDENIKVGKMLDYAHEANNTIVKANKENAGAQFNFYNDELRKIRLINEDMELRMESALKNGEFQVFYQPKYNLNLNRQDGAEALVRWYDKETGVYNRPDLFMALFESNGFVIKIDKYVFERVCEYINYSMAHGRTVYPISVNISRVTAIQPDFVEYYSKIKRKYGISDGQIMIEFTESFAYENYEFLNTIVEKLHDNGFKCSIDDFGCGYSSYRILKSLPMDEIKLDKLFMDKGLSEQRDTDIMDSIIRLAKKLKMKVTQEGVETQDGVEFLRKIGCDVIQGYKYAKPMALSDYIKFVSSSREHNL